MSTAFTLAQRAARRAAEAATDAAEAIGEGRYDLAETLMVESERHLITARMRLQEARDDR